MPSTSVANRRAARKRIKEQFGNKLAAIRQRNNKAVNK